MRVVSWPVFAAAALCCLGCVPKLEKPTLTVVNVEVLKSNLWEQRLRVHLRVQNPNDRALAVQGLSYTIEVAEQEFAHGASEAAFTVPALGEAQFDVDASANVAGTLLTLLSRHDALAGQIDYRIYGKVALSAGWLRSIPFEQRGTFKLQ